MPEIDIATLVANLGFPIGITLYLLIRFEKKISDLSEAINSLKNEIQKNVKK
ncbi:YvrJ family protein [Paenibacillus sp. FSL H7-0756]|uniref:YvrJ family protein n=1 Tax=unclassified Paenibacillus TaxID=185978 RepID=UPI00096D395D|nr:YvrJ family protein [Paenibacillus sp. FSL R7-0337]OMF98082.1 YvrJ family protein [Paenibacillus sp. FSL R7-0337]